MSKQRTYPSKKSKTSRGKVGRKVKNTGGSNASYWPYLLIIVFGFLLYGNTIQYDYTLDDVFSITSNSHTMKGFSGIPDLLTTNYFSGFLGDEDVALAGGRYRPLSLITFAIEVEFLGANPHFSHFINILLYIFLGILLFKALNRYLKPDSKSSWYLGLAFVATLLFFFHPVHTEVVANIKGRDEILVFIFSLLALRMVHLQLEFGKPQYYFFSFLLFFLALMSKENALTFILVIPLTLYFFTVYKPSKILVSSLPLMAATIIFLIIRFSILEGTGAKPSENLMDNPFLEASLSQRFGTIFYTLGRYIQLLIFPHPLTWDYYPYHIELKEIFSIYSLVPALLYLAGGVYALYTFKTKSIITYALLFWFITLSVASNVFINIGTFMAERFLFIPSLAFALALGYFIIEKLPPHIKNIRLQNLRIYIVLPILMLYSIKTIERNTDWKDNFTLYTTDVETSVNSAKGNNIAAQFYAYEAAKLPSFEDKKKYYEIAVEKLHKAVNIYPGHADAWFQLGSIHYNLYADMDSLVSFYSKVLEFLPGEEKVFQNIASALKIKNDTALSIKTYTALHKTVPLNYTVNYELTRLYGGKNNYDSTLKYAEQVLAIRPDDISMTEYAAYLYFSIGEYEKSLEYYEKMHARDPGNKNTLINLVSVCSRLKMPEKLQEYNNKLAELN